MVTHIVDNIYTFPIELPDNPLKWLNCYVIKSTSGKSLLIDTGFNRPECLEALLDGMRELELTPETTDVFLTHLHSDHTGNAAVLQKMGCRLLMGRLDSQARLCTEREGWGPSKARALAEGMPPDVLENVFANNPAVIYSSRHYDVTELEAGTVLSYGGHDLECIHTPGHTVGHLCLYDRKNRVMFLGDHVLFDISPNISVWGGGTDALEVYLDSLRKIREYDIETALPAHRNTSDLTVAERVDALLEHHARRLESAERIIGETPGLDAYALAGKMPWRIRCNSWEEFPPGQKWFALGETIAHLNYLEKHGRIIRTIGRNGCAVYDVCRR